LRSKQPEVAAFQDLSLGRLWVIYPGSQVYAIDDNISIIPIAALPTFAGLL
jgi:hypothetical protein